MYITAANPIFSAQMLDIYAPFTRNGVVTFETEPPTLADFEKRVEKYTQTHPWLAAVEGNRVIGYAYASPYRERIAYQWVAECSVYVHPSEARKGVATRLYKALLELLTLQGFYKVFAIITIPNNESVGFHEKMGFQWFATYKKVGYKHGEWRDVAWWEKVLQDLQVSPLPTPLAFSKLGKAEVQAILNRYADPYDRDKL